MAEELSVDTCDIVDAEVPYSMIIPERARAYGGLDHDVVIDPALAAEPADILKFVGVRFGTHNDPLTVYPVGDGQMYAAVGLQVLPLKL